MYKKIKFFDRSFVRIDLGRWSLSILFWCTPGIEWNRPGYDQIWTSWGVFPLFDVERFNLDENGEYIS